jgi:O-antigen/teichoic acid export membrane protein
MTVEVTADEAGAEAPRPHRGRHDGGVAKRAWYGVLAQAVDKFLPVAVLLYLARTLTREQFGVYAFVLAYLMFFQALSDNGIDTVLVRTMSQRPERRAEILRAGLGLKLLLAIVSALVSVVLVGPASGGQVPLGLMAVAALSLPTAFGGAYRAYFRSTLEIGAVLTIVTHRAVLYAFGVVVAVVMGGGLVALFGALATANLLNFFSAARMVRGRVAPGLSFDREIWRDLLRGAVPLVANALALTISYRIGQILLMSLGGPVEVGRLSAPSRITEAFGVLPDALMVTVYPLMAGLHVLDTQRLRRTASRSARYLVVAVGVPITLCCAAGSEIMNLLFGAAFADTGHLLAIMSFTVLLGATGTVSLNLLIAVHREAALFRITLVFALIGTLLAWLGIHLYGATGAAVAVVATSSASQIALALMPRTGEYVRPALFAGFRAALAVCAGAATGVALSDHPFVASAVALSVYAVALVILGVANRDEWEFVRMVFAAARNQDRG